MKISLRQHARYIAPVTIFATVLVPAILVMGSATHVHAELVFLRAMQDEATYSKDPTRYDRVVVPPSSPNARAEVYFVERVPALRVGLKEIKSVMAERSQYDPDITKLTEEVLRSRGKGERILDDPDDYTVTFSLSARGAKRVKQFVDAYDREKFETRFMRQSLGVARFLGPFEGDLLSLYTRKDTVVRLKKRFPRLKMK